MNRISFELSKSIKENSWVYIEYENKQSETTYFWIAIKDIYVNKTLRVDMFNPKYYDEGNKEILEASINFDSIIAATMLEQTTYHTPDKLYEKIENHIHQLKWLGYDYFDSGILTYLKRAFEMDNPPYLLNTDLVEGIDEKVLKKEGSVTLNGRQIDQMTRHILNEKDKQSNSQTLYTIHSLALNDLSIVTAKGNFLIAYYPIKFNPRDMSLSIDDTVSVNKVFFKDGFAHNIKNYLNMDSQVFIEEYQDNKQLYKQFIYENLKKKETLNDLPYITKIGRDITVNLKKEYDEIAQKHESKTMNTPLIAFFGNMTQRMKKRTDRSVVVLDNRVNIDQLRAIHNAMKQYITYVQGPPGTGKTQTILNVMISALFNNDSVLVCSSNNHPLDGIVEKMGALKYKNNIIPFPMLRLGNKKYMLEALEQISALYERCKSLKVYEQTLEHMKTQKSEDMEKLNQLLDAYENRVELEEKLAVLESLKNGSATDFHASIIVEDEIQAIQDSLRKMPEVTNESALELVQGADEQFFMWLNFMSIYYIQQLSEDRYKPLFDIIDTEDDEARYKAFKEYLSDKRHFKNLQRVFPFMVSTLHSIPKIGQPQTLFDLCVIDEAGQANIAISLPALLRGERAMLVGDPNQLAPIVTVDPGINDSLRKVHKVSATYDFANNSLLKTMQAVDRISKFIMLRYHYRSARPIINFSNQKYYDGKLIIKTEKPHAQALKFIDVDNGASINQRHIAPNEQAEINNIVKNYKGKTIGIITPFRKQKEHILECLTLPKDSSVEVGTIHSFQGDEKDVVIISPAIDKQTREKTFDWIKNNRELLNVGTTRAREQLIIVGDYQAIKANSDGKTNDLLELCDYLKDKNYQKISTSDTSANHNPGLKVLNSKFENVFLETIQHLFSVHTSFKVKEKIAVKSVFEKDSVDVNLLDYYFRSEFDFVVYDSYTQKPLMAIELDGEEHYTNGDVKKRDEKKMRLCQQQGLRLLRIPNDYVRRYQFIRDIILKMLQA